MDQLISFFEELGLSDKETLVYKALLKRKEATLLQLARDTCLPRTTLYRLIENMIKTGICKEIPEDKSKKVQAVKPQELYFLIEKKRQKIQEIEQEFPKLQKILEQEGKDSYNNAAEVLFYRGKDGLKQMIWHELESKELLSYYYLTEVDIFGKTFAKRYREICYERGITEREIISTDDPYLTKENIVYYTKGELFKNYMFRYIPAEQLKIDHQVTIYNDVVCFFDWNTEGEIFGVEIHSKAIASLQKQIFEILWSISLKPEEALKMKVSSNNAHQKVV